MVKTKVIAKSTTTFIANAVFKTICNHSAPEGLRKLNCTDPVILIILYIVPIRILKSAMAKICDK